MPSGDSRCRRGAGVHIPATSQFGPCEHRVVPQVGSMGCPNWRPHPRTGTGRYFADSQSTVPCVCSGSKRQRSSDRNIRPGGGLRNGTYCHNRYAPWAVTPLAFLDRLRSQSRIRFRRRRATGPSTRHPTPDRPRVLPQPLWSATSLHPKGASALPRELSAEAPPSTVTSPIGCPDCPPRTDQTAPRIIENSGPTARFVPAKTAQHSTSLDRPP